MVVVTFFLCLLKFCKCDPDPLQYTDSKDGSCTSAFKQIKVYASVMQVEEEFEPVTIEPVCKIYSEHNYCWETGFTLELFFFITLKQ